MVSPVIDKFYIFNIREFVEKSTLKVFILIPVSVVYPYK